METIEMTADVKVRSVPVFIVDDHPIVRQGLRQLIDQEEGFIVCGEAENGTQTFAALKVQMPGVMMMDLSLKNENGLELVKNLKALYPALPVLVVSVSDEEFYAERAIHAGAMGYIMKTQAANLIIKAIRCIMGGEVYLSDSVSARILRKMSAGNDDSKGSPVDKLSNRELQVFNLIGTGLGTRQIAERLSRSVKTVETYREHIKSKLDLKDSSELVQNAIQWLQSQ